MYDNNRIKVKSPIKVFDYKKFYEGTIYKNNFGIYAKIIDYRSTRDLTIQFLDTGFIKDEAIKHLISGGFMDTSDEFIYNTIFTNSKGISFKILEFDKEGLTKVQFLDTGFIKDFPTIEVKRRSINNPYTINSSGGYFGEGKYKYNEKVHSIWIGILDRTINKNKNYISKYDKYYHNIYLDDIWLCYQNFADWYYKNIFNLNHNIIYNVDKDLIQIGKYPKVYSPTTCIIIPQKINVFMECIYKYNSELPVGVMRSNRPSNHKKPYYVYLDEYRHIDKYKRHTMFFNDKLEAFEMYRKNKLNQLHYLSDYFYSINALTKKTKDIIDNINIFPFGN